MTEPYQALLVVSFGGPEGMDDVIPFLENVLRGRNVPRERMLEVAKHYELFNGISPINAQNRNLIAALNQEFAANGLQLPVYFGNRNWHPLLADALKQMRDDGIRNALAFVTSAYSSYSSCRQYLENIETARALVGIGAPQIDKLRVFYNHPGFIEANVDNVQRALAKIPESGRANTHLVFTAHSIPISMADNCEYEAQLRETARLVADGVSQGNESHPYKVVYQSRSGPPTQPWLEPDVGKYLRELKAEGATDVVLAPIGFISDHMEVVYELDTEAQALCRNLDLNLVRAATVSAHPTFVKMVRELIMERLDPASPQRSLGALGPSHDRCAADCCVLSR